MAGSRQSKSLKSGEAGLVSVAAGTVLPPGLLATYRPEEVLGAGAMGVVWRATHLALDRPVAIKLATSLQRELVTRFVREGRLLARLEHPNLVRVHDAGVIDGCPYLVMELVRGVTLSALAGGRALAPQTVVALGVQLLDGLAHAHAAGVLHRDVKSENVLVTPEGVLKLADFGLVTSAAKADTLVGTTGYIPPEGPGTAAADLFSFGNAVVGNRQRASNPADDGQHRPLGNLRAQVVGRLQQFKLHRAVHQLFSVKPCRDNQQCGRFLIGEPGLGFNAA